MATDEIDPSRAAAERRKKRNQQKFQRHKQAQQQHSTSASPNAVKTSNAAPNSPRKSGPPKPESTSVDVLPKTPERRKSSRVLPRRRSPSKSSSKITLAKSTSNSSTAVTAAPAPSPIPAPAPAPAPSPPVKSQFRKQQILAERKAILKKRRERAGSLERPRQRSLDKKPKEVTSTEKPKTVTPSVSYPQKASPTKEEAVATSCDKATTTKTPTISPSRSRMMKVRRGRPKPTNDWEKYLVSKEPASPMARAVPTIEKITKDSPVPPSNAVGESSPLNEEAAAMEFINAVEGAKSDEKTVENDHEEPTLAKGEDIFPMDESRDAIQGDETQPNEVEAVNESSGYHRYQDASPSEAQPHLVESATDDHDDDPEDVQQTEVQEELQQTEVHYEDMEYDYDDDGDDHYFDHQPDEGQDEYGFDERDTSFNSDNNDPTLSPSKVDPPSINLVDDSPLENGDSMTDTTPSPSDLSPSRSSRFSLAGYLEEKRSFGVDAMEHDRPADPETSVTAAGALDPPALAVDENSPLRKGISANSAFRIVEQDEVFYDANEIAENEVVHEKDFDEADDEQDTEAPPRMESQLEKIMADEDEDTDDGGLDVIDGVGQAQIDRILNEPIEDYGLMDDAGYFDREYADFVEGITEHGNSDQTETFAKFYNPVENVKAAPPMAEPVNHDDVEMEKEDFTVEVAGVYESFQSVKPVLSSEEDEGTKHPAPSPVPKSLKQLRATPPPPPPPTPPPQNRATRSATPPTSVPHVTKLPKTVNDEDRDNAEERDSSSDLVDPKKSDKEKEADTKSDVSAGWDTRSVHDVPPESAKDVPTPEPPVDPSWDTSNAAGFFGAVAVDEKKSADMDMFDTSSWAAASDVAFSNFSDGPVPGADNTFMTEETEGDNYHDEIDKVGSMNGSFPTPVVQEEDGTATEMPEERTNDAADQYFSGPALDVPNIVPEETQVADSAYIPTEHSVNEVGEEKKDETELRDDESLLAESDVRSDVVGPSDRGTLPAISETDQPSQQERIDIYTNKAKQTRAEGYVSSSDEEEMEEDENDEEDFVGEAEKPDYVMHDTVLNDKEAIVPPAIQELILEIGDAAEVATFKEAAEAAAKSGESARSSTGAPSDTGTDVAASSDVAVSSDAVVRNVPKPAQEQKKRGMPIVQLENLDLITDENGEMPSALDVGSVASSTILGEGLIGSVAGHSLGSKSRMQHSPSARSIKRSPQNESKPFSPDERTQLPESIDENKAESEANEESRVAPAVPLIPPPPEEKLRKWEESKFVHLSSIRSGRAEEVMKSLVSTKESPSRSTIKSLAETIASSEGSLTNKEAAKQKWKESRKAGSEAGASKLLSVYDGSTDLAVMTPPNMTRMTKNSTEAPWETQPNARPGASSEVDEKGVEVSPNGEYMMRGLEVSPAAGLLAPALSMGSRTSSKSSLGDDVIIRDTKMAEKLARASSHAAKKFEKNFKPEPKKKEPEEQPIDPPTPSSPGIPEDPGGFYSCAPDFLGAMSAEVGAMQAEQKVKQDLNARVRGEFQAVAAETAPKEEETDFELVGGAFSTWKNADYAEASDAGDSDYAGKDRSMDKSLASLVEPIEKAVAPSPITEETQEAQIARWLTEEVFVDVDIADEDVDSMSSETILRDDTMFEKLCYHVTEKVNESVKEDKNSVASTLLPFRLLKEGKITTPGVQAANFVSFLKRMAVLSSSKSPFGEENPFVLELIRQSGTPKSSTKTFQDHLLEQGSVDADALVRFFFVACHGGEEAIVEQSKDELAPLPSDSIEKTEQAQERKYLRPPKESPSPFETSVWNNPNIVAIMLSFLGDPVVVCRMKMVNQFCKRLIGENEHTIIRDAVRLGGISMNVRPSFWMWITLEKTRRTTVIDEDDSMDLTELAKVGKEGKWDHVIERDVARAFGNMPPHKTGAKIRTNSIVPALVTFGQGRLMKRGVKGGGEQEQLPNITNEKQRQKKRLSQAPPPWEINEDEDAASDTTPTDTVSEWGGISPVGSFANNSVGEDKSEKKAKALSGKLQELVEGIPKDMSRSPSRKRSRGKNRGVEELALSGNALTYEMKQGLQDQLRFILHALAAAHSNVGYCQGMDYVVAHLLRVLQGTVRWRAVKGSLPDIIKAKAKVPLQLDIPDATMIDDEAVDKSQVVEETVFRVMDCFFTPYNLRHMYWPELRCLKTCCLVFEQLIKLKLPVLADHFEHHELNVGLFALGWFQTLFLYLPSMPSATVCHMWDIWLVERSFKIFFRVGTAILFLSQPILLNHELEGMMTYLNTFPDATLLNPDILIACALQIKVTNRMLMELEMEVTGGR